MNTRLLAAAFWILSSVSAFAQIPCSSPSACTGPTCIVQPSVAFAICANVNLTDATQPVSTLRLYEDGTVIATKQASTVTAGVVDYQFPAGLSGGNRQYKVSAVGTGGETFSTTTIMVSVAVQVPPPTSGNLAIGKTATASESDGSGPPSWAVDGLPTTRWLTGCCNAPGKWFRINFGAPTAISRVVLQWYPGRYAKSYAIRTSNDGNAWASSAAYTTAVGDGGFDDFSFPSVTTVWLELQLLAYGDESGYSLWEFEAYGSGGSAAPLTLNTPTLASVASPNGQPVSITFPMAVPAGGTPPYLPVTSTPVSPSNFPVGTTPVQFTVTDSAVPPVTVIAQVNQVVTYTPPSTTLPGSATLNVQDCTVTARSSGAPPTTQTGWRVTLRRNILGSSTLTTIGSQSPSSYAAWPYVQTSGTIAKGTYVVTEVWARSGSTSVPKTIGQYVCGGTLP